MNQFGAKQAAQRIERGELTADKYISACRDRIAERDGDVRAWQFLPGNPKAEAAGPLRGIPVGVKDIFDTFDMPTEYGSPIYKGHRPPADAAAVALARRAGATVLGKTVTCEFATFVPSQTRNPLDLTRTPGGSSSGSAAAVADFHVPLAFGTQTAGSIIRPGAYCGVVAYKPTYGLLSRAGVKPNAESLDTVGFFARSVEDVAFFMSALSGLATGAVEKPRIGSFRTELKGARPIDISNWDKLVETQRTIHRYEGARVIADEFRRSPDKVHPKLRERCELGMAIPLPDYLEAQRYAAECRVRVDELFGGCDVLVAPSATGEAPKGLESTGDTSLNIVWTLLHLPCVSIPWGRGPAGMPLGIQVIGRFGDDARTLACAEWIHSQLGGRSQ
jgi:Asp-tRNA(Asn)/Glu-tRNA(Gln) amidotransferase A subunit family amidase